jgi:hypothetical protein
VANLFVITVAHASSSRTLFGMWATCDVPGLHCDHRPERYLLRPAVMFRGGRELRLRMTQYRLGVLPACIARRSARAIVLGGRLAFLPARCRDLYCSGPLAGIG